MGKSLQNIHINQILFVCPFIFFSRNEGDNDFMNIILNELNTQVRFWSNRPHPVVSEVNISRLYCFCATEGNFGFSDCRGGERSWSVCSGRTQWTGGRAGTTVRARACLWSSHIASEIRPSSEYYMFWSLGCWRFCRGRGLEKTAGSKAKPTAWHEGRKWRPCCSSTASLSHPQRNKATTLRFSYILIISKFKLTEKHKSVSDVYNGDLCITCLSFKCHCW